MSHPPRGAFQGPNTTAYQRFLPTGPIAFLPVSPTASSLVWSTKPPLASALLASDPAVLARMINAAFRLPDMSMRYLHKLILEHQAQGTPLTEFQIAQEILWRENSHGIDINSAYTSSSADATSLNNVGIPPADSELLPPLVTSIQPGTAASFPLRFNHTEMYIGEGEGSRTVLVGDAAHTVHPLAGQGLNLGLGDVECLARCIHEAVLKGGDIGSLIPPCDVLSQLTVEQARTRPFYLTPKNDTWRTTNSCRRWTSSTNCTHRRLGPLSRRGPWG